MKKSSLYVGTSLLVVLVLSVSAYAVNYSGSLQGRLFGVKSGTLSLNSASPYGARTASVADTVLVFDVTASSTKDLTLKPGAHLDLTFTTDDSTGDIDSFADGDEVVLIDNASGMEAGKGYIVTDTMNTAYAAIYANIGMRAGETLSYSVVVDTDSLLTDESGADDSLVVSLQSDAISGTVTGNTLDY